MASRRSLWRLPAMRQLVVATLLGFTSFALTLASLPAYAVRLGASLELAGLVTTVMLICTVAAQTAVPAMVGRFGTGQVLVAGLIALGAPAPLYLLSDGLAPMLAVSAVRGLGFAVLTVLGSTLTAQIAPPGRRGEAVGIYGLAISVPNLIAVPAGAALVSAGQFGWVAILSASPVLAIPAALVLGRVTKVATGPSATGSRTAVVATLAPTGVLLVVTLAGGGFVTFIPIELPTGLVAPLSLLIFGVTAAVGRWRAGMLADAVGTGRLLPGFLILGVVGLVCLVVGLQTGNSPSLLIGAAVFGASFGAVQNLTLLVAFARAGSEHPTTASAVWNAGFDAGTAIGALAVGSLAGLITLPWSFAICAGLLALALPLARVATADNAAD